MRLSVLVLTSLATSAFAYSLDKRQSGFPPCALTCITSADRGGCGGSDIACLCRNQAFIDSNTRCITANCKGADFTAAVNAAQQICASAGVTYSSSAPAQTSTPAKTQTNPPPPPPPRSSTAKAPGTPSTKPRASTAPPGNQAHSTTSPASPAFPASRASATSASSASPTDLSTPSTGLSALSTDLPTFSTDSSASSTSLSIPSVSSTPPVTQSNDAAAVASVNGIALTFALSVSFIVVPFYFM